MDCLFRRNDSEQVQKAVSIMTGGESASKKPSVIKLNLVTTHANQLKRRKSKFQQAGLFSQVLCLTSIMVARRHKNSVCRKLVSHRTHATPSACTIIWIFYENLKVLMGHRSQVERKNGPSDHEPRRRNAAPQKRTIGASLLLVTYHGCYSRSQIIAMPCPPPMQAVAKPYRPPRRDNGNEAG
jgi:hypothetical protein